MKGSPVRVRASALHSGTYRRLIAPPKDPTRTEEWVGDLHTWRLEDNG
jgi:hypothetical protein